MNGFSCAVVVGFVNALLWAAIDAQIPLIFCFQAVALSAGDALPLPPPELLEPLLPQPASSAVIAATASTACARLMSVLLIGSNPYRGSGYRPKLRDLVN